MPSGLGWSFRNGTFEGKIDFLIDQAILKNCKKRHTYLAMAWSDYLKASDMIPHGLIMESAWRCLG